MRGQRHAPTALYPRERLGTHCTGGWLGPRAGLDRCGKISPPPGFDPRTVQPAASRYTDWATRPTLNLISCVTVRHDNGELIIQGLLYAGRTFWSPSISGLDVSLICFEKKKKKVRYLCFETLCITGLVIMADLSYAKHLLYMQSLLNIVGSGCMPVSLILGVRVQPTC